MKYEFKTKLDSKNTSVYKYKSIDSIDYDDCEITSGTLYWNIEFNDLGDGFSIDYNFTSIELELSLINWTDSEDLKTEKRFYIENIDNDLYPNYGTFMISEVTIDLENKSANVSLGREE